TDGATDIVDYMHIIDKQARSLHKQLLPWLIRSVEVIRGEVSLRVELFPAFNYARDEHTTRFESYPNSKDVSDDVRVIFNSNGLSLDLRYIVNAGEHEPPNITWKKVTREWDLGPGVVAEFTLQEGQSIKFVLREIVDGSDKQPPGTKTSKEYPDPPLSMTLLNTLFKQSLRFWQNWISRSSYKGRWREHVHRSALALKLMTYEPTGAVVASPTFGLPEAIGGVRNWDYRYTWVRDSSFTVYALMRIGLTEEAESYMEFMFRRCHDLNEDGSLNIMYSIEGDKILPEIELNHLEGYRGSCPVRIGNSAFSHIQLDIYGELLDAIYLYNKYANPVSFDMWCIVRQLVNYVVHNWRQVDMGIWEVRGKKQHFTFSKIMCWVAVDRDRSKWLETRDEIYEEIMTRAWNPDQRMFSQSYESTDTLDSSLLIMPLVFFLSPTDPRFLDTMNRILRSPAKGGLTVNNFVYRYDHLAVEDGVGGIEGSFSMCTFWLIEALTRAGRFDKDKLERAEFIFEQMIGFLNHLGLYSEEVAQSGELLGNFPQAFTHIAFISAAFNLDRVLNDKHKII
ncbi:2067_t:CDS:2, partial [Paraglomus occultum]